MNLGSEKFEIDPARPYLALASSDGLAIDLHLGQAESLRIYKLGAARPEMLETRAAPKPSKGLGRWMELAELLKDCGMLLTSGIGEAPLLILSNKEIKVYVVEGSVDKALELAFSRGDLSSMAKYKDEACSKRQRGGCGGGGGGGCYGA